VQRLRNRLDPPGEVPADEANHHGRATTSLVPDTLQSDV
jgi:hypothetical protein